MARCDFCSKIIDKGTGKKFVMKDGKVLDFCSKKCEISQTKLHRVSRTTKWTVEYRRIRAGQK